MSVLQDNCHTATKTLWNISDLKFVCVCKSLVHTFIYVRVCVQARMKSHVNTCVIIWCVFSTVRACICVWLSCMGLQLGSSSVIGSGGSLCWRDYHALHVYTRDPADTHVPASLPGSRVHTRTNDHVPFLKSPANQHSLPCRNVREKLKVSTTQKSKSQPDYTGTR